jgi:hypothetical protein
VMTGVQLRSRVRHPRLLSDEEIRQAHRVYMDGRRGLRSVAAQYGISHVQLAASFHRLRLEVKGNRSTDPDVIADVIALRESNHTWSDIAGRVGLSLRQVQHIYGRKD